MSHPRTCRRRLIVAAGVVAALAVIEGLWWLQRIDERFVGCWLVIEEQHNEMWARAYEFDKDRNGAVLTGSLHSRKKYAEPLTWAVNGNYLHTSWPQSRLSMSWRGLRHRWNTLFRIKSIPEVVEWKIWKIGKDRIECVREARGEVWLRITGQDWDDIVQGNKPVPRADFYENDGAL